MEKSSARQFDCILESASLNDTNDLVLALRPVARSLQALGVRFYVGGSVASSFHGAVRSTMDVDLVCELKNSHIESFLNLIGDEFYVSDLAMREAIRRKSCFNLIHLPTSFKVDVFVSRQRPFDVQTTLRAQFGSLGQQEPLSVPIATPEDIIVIKLEWYRLTNETSERQWNDVSRLLSLLSSAADIEYLRQAAESVGVADLLDKLLTQQT
jgi:hypothetical protein